ncbi:hypothetical protein K438DRAFT_855958 [Mycena galopus ATCC 62051]|nr:hypothetical protein K438DRAFT_855958 [Mycena galopus ATCC 62051]
MSLLGNKDSAVVVCARDILSAVAQSEGGAQAIVNAKSTDISMLLESPNPETLQWTCDLVGRLASHNSVAPAMSKFIVLIVSLLGNENNGVIEWAVYTLFQIARSEDSVRAIVNSKATDYIPILLKSPQRYTRQWACDLVGRLASYDFIAPVISKVIAQLVSLLQLGPHYPQ